MLLLSFVSLEFELPSSVVSETSAKKIQSRISAVIKTSKLLEARGFVFVYIGTVTTTHILAIN